MTPIIIIPEEVTAEFGHCTTIDRAHRIIASHGGTSHIDSGTLVLRYPGQLARRVEPIWVNALHGWLVPFNEVRPERK